MAAQTKVCGSLLCNCSEQIKGAFIRGCRAVAGTGTFIKLSGTDIRGVVLSGNDLSRAKTPVSLGSNVSPAAVENSE